MRHFLNLADAGHSGVSAMLDDALRRKQARHGWPCGKADPDAPLAGHTLAMIFEKSSTRTRVSFDMAIRQLGGTALVLEGGSTQLGRGESIADTARVLSRMVDAIMIRTDDHAKIEDLARHATVPVINGLTDLSHPCQIMADMLAVIEHRKALPGLKWAWAGDGNNVLHSLIEAASLMQFDLHWACPKGFAPDPSFVALQQRRVAGTAYAGSLVAAASVEAAAADADVIVTDTWVSMGQADSAAKIAAMQPYQVNDALMARARPDALFLHCLPAHRGEEVTDSVIDGPQSVVWDEAENRLHAQKSVLRWVFGQI